MSSIRLFVYGSLMFEKVWFGLTRQHHQKTPATLPGYARFVVRGQSYPGIRRISDAKVEGFVMHDLNHHTLRLLDRFEGNYYQREKVQVFMADSEALTCETYIFKPRYLHLLSDIRWSAEDFAQKHLKYFLNQYSG